jgi:hypothetical protein
VSWTVHFVKQGSDAVVTREVPYLGASFCWPRAHRCVSWFTRAVFTPISIDPHARTVIAKFSHFEKDHLDRPRDSARLPA